MQSHSKIPAQDFGGLNEAAATSSRLARISTRDVPGLPDVSVPLHAVTALIGPRATGKSRLLAAISWLLSGEPALVDRGARDPWVEAELQPGAAAGGPRTVVRSADSAPTIGLPSCTFFPAAARLAVEAGAERLLATVEQLARDTSVGEVLLIEEPELDLNPHTQRYLYRLLRTYGERNQVIYSTRSPSFVDAVFHYEIVRLDSSHAGVAVRRAPSSLLTDEERLRLTAEFDHERSEMFFARAVVLVEGQTERQALPLIFRSLGHDPDALGIAIIEVGGKGNLPLAARLLDELAIPHVLVYDSDRGRPGAELNARLAQASPRAPHFALDPDFEGAVGLDTRDDKVFNAWRRFSRPSASRIPGVLRAIVAEAVRLAGGP